MTDYRAGQPGSLVAARAPLHGDAWPGMDPLVTRTTREAPERQASAAPGELSGTALDALSAARDGGMPARDR